MRKLVHCHLMAVWLHLAQTGRSGGQGSFPVGTPGNGVPKVTLTVGTAFKPALGELHKKHPVCTKIRLFQIQHPNFFCSPDPPQWGGGHPSHTHPPRRLRRLVPHLLILEPPMFGSHTSFSRKRSLLAGEHRLFSHILATRYTNM